MVDALGPKQPAAPAAAASDAGKSEKTQPQSERIKVPFKDGTTHPVYARFDNADADFGPQYRSMGFVEVQDKNGSSFYVSGAVADKIDGKKMDVNAARQEAKAEKANQEAHAAGDKARTAADELAKKGGKPGETAGHQKPRSRF